MKPEFQAFDLPTDGLTRMDEIGRYGMTELWQKGWTLVGVATVQVHDNGNGDAGPKSFGVFRMTESEAVRAAMGEVEAANKERDEAKKAAEALKAQLIEADRRAAALRGELDGIYAESATTEADKAGAA